ncbi:MFS transporter [Aquincola sp. S2]|uniref:MFS transporter n=2 Tax=Pseudaquabacterium terrae TaxID=2732868 RepID=A0ABX2EDC0_9BURK|nr:MFS transporter [Aquabacterium terrae]
MVQMFLAFAFAYFFSALLRAVTATLAPTFSNELGLGAGALGLLAGAYFLGFAAMQLPLGSALDRFGPKRVLMVLLAVAAVGCACFGAARDLPQLLVARLLIGVGVSACLMAPLTCYRRRFGPTAQLRTNSWMLMTGSLGMLFSTLPVQWLLPVLGWRGLFLAVAVLLLVSIAAIAFLVPRDDAAHESSAAAAPNGGYREVLRHPVFVRMAPLGFFAYGGMVAMQSLWIGPWLTQVAGHSPGGAARGLFIVNLSMLVAFLCWGLLMPRLVRSGWDADRIIARAWPLGVACLGAILWFGPAAGAGAWAAWCVLTSVVSLSQPAVAQAFPSSLAGRALSAFNLVIFAGVFAVQWGIGLALDALRALGWAPLSAYRASLGLFLAGCLLAFLWAHWHRGAAAVLQPTAGRT